jgi:hypothetical protein
VAISAGIVGGRKATGTVAIKDDLENAGAIWVDMPAFREGHLVWGRVVADIPAFCRELVAALAESELGAALQASCLKGFFMYVQLKSLDARRKFYSIFSFLFV